MSRDGDWFPKEGEFCGGFRKGRDIGRGSMGTMALLVGGTNSDKVWDFFPALSGKRIYAENPGRILMDFV